MIAKSLSRRRLLTSFGALAAGVGVAALVSACGSGVQPTPPPAAQPTAAPAPPTTAPTTAAPTTAPVSPTAAQTTAPTAAPAASAAPAATTSPVLVAPTAAPTSAPATLPSDAAPVDKQILTIMGLEGRYLEWTKTVRDYQWNPFLISEPPVRPNINYEITPAAAEKWEVSPDGLTWTFHLRAGMKWSDGTPLTANDYVFAIQRMADPNTGFDVAWFYSFIKGFKDANSGKAKLDSIAAKALDDTTLAITTEGPTPFLSLVMTEVPPAPKHIITQYGDNWSLDPKTCVSSGPYKLDSWDKGRQLVFVNNPAYNGPSKALLNQIVYKIGADAALFPAYQNGEIDAIIGDYESVLSPADQARVKSDPVLSKELHTWPQFQTWWMSYNIDTTAFKDVRVRQAFTHAIDRVALANSALQGKAIPAWGMLPPGFYAYNLDNVQGIQNFDVAKAKQLLADAGFPDGKGFPQYDLFLRAPSPTVSNVGQALQAMIKQNLGITVGVQSFEQKSFMDRLNAHNIPLYLISWDMDYYDASNFLDVFKGGGREGWHNADYDMLIKQADTTVGDEAKRKSLYQQAEKILVSDGGAVFLWHPIYTQLWKSYIQGSGFVKNQYGILGWQQPQSGPQFYSAYITKDKK